MECSLSLLAGGRECCGGQDDRLVCGVYLRWRAGVRRTTNTGRRAALSGYVRSDVREAARRTREEKGHQGVWK